ncbi:malonyl-CoA O-methyltransferase [Franzmannia pantelleriensis]|uniref:Malonyl-CoA O-methyltransferase n=1 Tax=Franzmannia pantelleriensis TaxID=48727 RepID=A0A1G9VMJ4_9GAMM|nr:methyltransferase domain-containing protein [Halomonas pantelleriensis]SDM73293.1 malonyl-CoA O-methyltransferase [Halomonas pantelleriensis]
MNMPAPLAATRWQRNVARSFGRAAPRYLALSGAQQHMGEALWQHLPRSATSILDLGCGPGHWTTRLATHYRTSALGLDLAPGMLAEAQRRCAGRGHWLCADAARLPLADASHDLVFSNLALQWCPDLAQVFAELHRVLAPGATALINTLAPGTLAEVAEAWSRPQALLDFLSAEQVAASSHAAGFSVHIEQVAERFHYPDLAAVMASIKGVGAQQPPPAGQAPLTRSDLMRARQRYERLREPAGLPVTYQRLTLILQR